MDDEEIILSSTPRQFDGDIGMIIELLMGNVHLSDKTSTWRDIGSKGDNHFVFRCPTELAHAFKRYFDSQYIHVEDHPHENWSTVWHTKYWSQSKYLDRKKREQEQREQDEKRRTDIKISVTLARERRFKRMLSKIIGIGTLKGRALVSVERNFMQMLQVRYMDAGEEGIKAWIKERETTYKRNIYESPSSEETPQADTAIQ